MLALPPASQPAPRRQVFVGTAVAGAAGFMLIGGMMATWLKFRADAPVRESLKRGFIKDWMPFNISHAKDLVVLAYCHEGLVGIDVESRDAKLDIGAFSGCFCPEEQQMINGATDPLEAFLNLWVKKEAVLKAHGNGIVSGLDQIDCRNDDVSYEHQLWRLARLCLNEKYICYLATDNKEITVNLECVSLFGFM